MKAETVVELMRAGSRGSTHLAGLLKVHDERPGVLSLYLGVPLDLAELRGLPRVGEFLAEAAGDGRLADADRTVVRETLEVHGREWLGRTVAIFACADLGLREVTPLSSGVPGYEVPERAVLGFRPHIMPLVAALQWYPAYRVALIDRRHAWVFSITEASVGDGNEMAAPDAAEVASAGFGGWYGLDTYGVQRRVIELARHHYRDTAAMLEEMIRDRGPQPLVIGGHEDGIPALLACLSPAARESYAGSFAADPHILTPARVRELAAPVVARWSDQVARGTAAKIGQLPRGVLGTVGVAGCLAAVNALAVDQLIAPVDELVPGYACGTCGHLDTTPRCERCGLAGARIPDLVDEMACRVLEDGGHVLTTRGEASGLAARLRFPLPPR
jgi:Bacterial archaeo-eukaryotic release factor family 10